MLYLVYEPAKVADPSALAASLGVAQSFPLDGRDGEIRPGASGYAVVRRCGDGDTVLRGPVTLAQVAALGECAPATDETLRARLRTGRATNVTFLAVASPTAAQVAAQVKALTRQANALGRIALSETDSLADS